MNDLFLPLVLGFGFGWSLQKAGLSKYHKIVNVFRFTDLAVLKFMLTTLAVSMVGVFGLYTLGLIQLPTVPATYVVGNLVGGLIFGVGMAGAGFCPGTCAAGGGQGNLDYLIPGLLGFLTGALIYAAIYPSVFPTISAIMNLGSVILPQALDVNLWLSVLFFVLVAVTLFYFLERHGELRKDVNG
jgi:uncharacterized protein